MTPTDAKELITWLETLDTYLKTNITLRNPPSIILEDAHNQIKAIIEGLRALEQSSSEPLKELKAKVKAMHEQKWRNDESLEWVLKEIDRITKESSPA